MRSQQYVTEASFVGTKTPLVDPCKKIISVHRLVELLGIDVEHHAGVGVSSDPGDPHRVKAEA
jgi:hypothetical protein